MKEDRLDPQIEKLLNEVKLKQPEASEMTDYVSMVRSKIELKQQQPTFHFAPAGIAMASVVMLAGLAFLMFFNQPKKEVLEIPAVSVVSQSNPAPVPTPIQGLTLEEEMAILEAFSAESSDILGAEAVLEDLVLIDEVEFAITPSASQGTSLGS